MTPEQSVKVVSLLIQRIPNNWMKIENIKAYAESLVDLELQATLEAVTRLVATKKEFPSIADIREESLGRKKLDPIEAWGIVSMAVRKYGSYQVPEFDDATIKHCVDVMGWKTICESTNEMADRAHFAKLYSSVAERVKTEAVTKTLLLPASIPVLALKAMP